MVGNRAVAESRVGRCLNAFITSIVPDHRPQRATRICEPQNAEIVLSLRLTIYTVPVPQAIARCSTRSFILESWTPHFCDGSSSSGDLAF